MTRYSKLYLSKIIAFYSIDIKLFKCGNCGLEIEALEVQMEMPIFLCSKQKSDNPEQLCSEEQIEQRYNICSSCEFLENNSCMKCGCLLNRDRIYNNKLSHKNQVCPINRWGKISD